MLCKVAQEGLQLSGCQCWHLDTVGIYIPLDLELDQPDTDSARPLSPFINELLLHLRLSYKTPTPFPHSSRFLQNHNQIIIMLPKMNFCECTYAYLFINGLVHGCIGRETGREVKEKKRERD